MPANDAQISEQSIDLAELLNAAIFNELNKKSNNKL